MGGMEFAVVILHVSAPVRALMCIGSACTMKSARANSCLLTSHALSSIPAFSEVRESQPDAPATNVFAAVQGAASR